jgi:hypothetical protein
MSPEVVDSLIYVLIPLVLHALCSAIDATFPQPQPGSPWLLLRNFISVLALAIGHAKNAPPENPKALK